MLLQGGNSLQPVLALHKEPPVALAAGASGLLEDLQDRAGGRPSSTTNDSSAAPAHGYGSSHTGSEGLLGGLCN